MKIAPITYRRHFLAGLTAIGLLQVFAAPVSAASSTIKVELWDKPDGTQGITLNPDKIKAGKVTFVVTNASKTEQEHEFLVVKTNLTADKLPMTQGGARVDEDKLGHIDEVGDIEPGKTKKGTFTLTAGKYLLFCNEEGHMNAGMVTSFVVEP
jgi:uncharacterized cupredoxin-like copper-binding protein